MHGDGGADDFEGQMRVGALGRQQMSTGITDCLKTYLMRNLIRR